jgi:hypothetical protein
MSPKIDTKPGRRPSSPKSKEAGELKVDELVRIPIQLTRTQALRLKSAATARQTSVSELVRAAVDQYLGAAGKSGVPSLTKADIEALLKDR